MWYGGWDGGGTKTRVRIEDQEGRLLAEQDFGPLNPNGAEPERVRATVGDAVSFMARQPGGQEACGGLVIGAAGVSNRDVGILLGDALREAGWKRPYRLVGDQEIALAGAIEGYGAVLIAGTGAICYGRDREGKLFRVGGYGYLIDDVGSGYAIGRDILTATVRSWDGRQGPTCLARAVLDTLGVTEAGGVISWLYAPETGKKDIAALARLLEAALAAEDETALRIARRAAADLVELVTAGWRKTGLQDGELALTGGVLRPGSLIRTWTEEGVAAAYPAIRIHEPLASPAAGAVRLAMTVFQ